MLLYQLLRCFSSNLVLSFVHLNVKDIFKYLYYLLPTLLQIRILFNVRVYYFYGKHSLCICAPKNINIIFCPHLQEELQNTMSSIYVLLSFGVLSISYFCVSETNLFVFFFLLT